MIIVFILFATVYCSTLRIEEDEYTYTYEEFEEFAYVEVYEEDSDELKFQHDLASEYDDAIQGFGEEAPIYPDVKEDQEVVQGFGESIEAYSTEEDLVAQKGFGGGEDLYQPDADDNKVQGFGDSTEIYKEDNEKSTKGFGDATDIYSDQEEVELIPDMDLGFGEDDEEEPQIKKTDQEEENREDKKEDEQSKQVQPEVSKQEEDDSQLIPSDKPASEENVIRPDEKTQEIIKVGPTITIEEDVSEQKTDPPAVIKEEKTDTKPDKIEGTQENPKKEIIPEPEVKAGKQKETIEKHTEAKAKTQSKATESPKSANSKQPEQKSKSNNKEKKQETSAAKSNPKGNKSQLLTSNKQAKHDYQLIHHNKKTRKINKKVNPSTNL